MSLYKYKLNPLSGKMQKVFKGNLVSFKAGVATAASLPAVGNEEGDARVTNDNGHLHIWDGTVWQDEGDVIDIKWAALENKPSSSVENIDDSVSKKHIQGTDQKLDDGGANEIDVTEIERKATSDIFYYINPDIGSDSNPGTSGEPFETIQYAIDLIPKLLGNYITHIQLQDSVNYQENVNILAILGGNLYIYGNDFYPNNVVLHGNISILKDCSSLEIAGITFIQNNDGNSCILLERVQGVFINTCNFGTETGSDVIGIKAGLGSSVHVTYCGDASGVNKVAVGLRASFSGAMISYSETSFGETLFEATDGGLIHDTIQLVGADYDDAVTKKHSQGGDIKLRNGLLVVDGNGHTSIVGELKIKVYVQDAEPTLNGDNFVAVWIDTNDLNRVFLIFRRGDADQVMVEFS